MMLGKRSRHNSVKRTTSLVEFTFDPASVDVHATPADPQIATAGVGNGDGAAVVQPSDSQIISSVVCETEDPWNGTVTEVMCPRASGGGGGQFHHQMMHRRYSADFTQSLDVNTKDQIASHFLRDCSLCKRRLVPGRDIYMYRGDRAFCSSECRQQQITQDNRKEKSSLTPKKENISAAVSSSTLPPSSPSSSSPSPRKHVFAIGEMVTTTATTATTMCSY